MRVKMLTVGMFQSNCFIVSCEETNEAIIIDAGDDGERILAAVDELGVNVKMIVNTHAHIDHVAALPLVKSKLTVPVVMHKDEMPLYETLGTQAAMFGVTAPTDVKIDRFIQEGDTIEFGNLSADVIKTPGHSPGAISLVFRDENPPSIFVGDVLFQGSIGRTDLVGADHITMMGTLKDIIMKLPDEMVAYPGHGPTTTIGTEKRTNPFLLQLARE
jgi:glyoxylase-like metal-dependent hydrolase (beta-lactamase superfamily II)